MHNLLHNRLTERAFTKFAPSLLCSLLLIFLAPALLLAAPDSLAISGEAGFCYRSLR